MPYAKKQTTMKQPHDNWSKYYDFVYERTFGNFYHNLTELTLDKISEIIKEGTILDFGAGTGRLTIPLKQNGYEVIAIEKSIGMVDELNKKCSEHKLQVPVFNCSIIEYSNGQAELAMALFTVLSYSITETELTNCIQTISQHIKPQGYFFFDLPNKVFFNSRQIINIQSKDFKRSVTLTKSGKNDIYIYKEFCSGLIKGKEFQYEDEFLIKYWDLNTINILLTEYGLIDTKDFFPEFGSTGSTYKLYQKI